MSGWMLVLTVLLCLMGTLVTAAYFFLRNLSRPLKAKCEVPETDRLGWWSYQKELEILKFEAHLASTALNLIRNQTLLHYSMTVRFKGSKEWRPRVGAIHCSEDFLSFNPDNVPFPEGFQGLADEQEPPETPEARLKLTPIIKVTHDPTYQGESLQCTFTNERVISAFHYGQNSIRIVAGPHHQDIVFYQRK